MPMDPEIEARVADLTGATPETASVRAERVTQSALIGFDSPAIDQAPVAIYAVDLAGRVQAWNQASEKLFGWTAAEVLGQPVPFLQDDRVEGAIQGLGALVQGHSFAEIDHTFLGKDGTPIHVVTSASLIRDDSGEPAVIMAFALDVTEKEKARRSLEMAEQRWRRLLENISDTVTVTGPEAQILETTGEQADVLGYEHVRWLGTQGYELVHPDDVELAMARYQEVLAHPGVEYRDVFRTQHADGHYEMIEYTAVNLLHDPAVEGVIITTRNVTAVKQAEALLADEAAILELIARDAPMDETLPSIVSMVERHSGGTSGILLLDAKDERISVGAQGTIAEPILRDLVRAGLASSGPATRSIAHRKPVVVADFETSTMDLGRLRLFIDHGLRGGWAAPIVDNRSDEVLGTIVVYHHRRGEPSDHERNVVAVACHLAAIAIDRDQAQRELFYQARHHQLTGLPNRRSILELLEDALARSRRNRTRLAVMFIDLDRFKVVNDSLGHAAGDQLLVRFGRRLQNLVRPGDFVGHFGADEFVVVLENVTDVDDARFVANRLDLALSEPFSIDDGEIFLSASLGVAVSETGEESSDMLIQRADAAMYRAKELGRDRLEVYDERMRTRATEQLRLDRELRLGVERSELAVHYQPEIDLATGRVLGVEALLRWNHPERGLVLPTSFIPAAEDTGLIVRIGRWVLDEAILQARSWVEHGVGREDIAVAVNLSARQLNSADLVAMVDRTLRRYDWPAEQLSLELTESILIDDAESTLQVLRELKSLGVKLAIDDFGTGYSSLSYLHRFPVDVVKIDRTFVSALRADGEGSPVATAVMSMARALGLLTAAEGVEEPEQLNGLRALGCDWAQGFLFSKPLPSEELEQLLRAQPTW